MAQTINLLAQTSKQITRHALYNAPPHARAYLSEQIRANCFRLPEVRGEIPYCDDRSSEWRAAKPVWLFEMWRFVSCGAGTCVAWIYTCV